jgi:hypothetical protein
MLENEIAVPAGIVLNATALITAVVPVKLDTVAVEGTPASVDATFCPLATPVVAAKLSVLLPTRVCADVASSTPTVREVVDCTSSSPAHTGFWYI